MTFFGYIRLVNFITEFAGADNEFSPWMRNLAPGRCPLIGVTRGKLLAQTETIDGRWIELGKAAQCRGNKIDLLHIGTAVGTGREVQSDPNFGQDEIAFVQILRGSIRDLTTSQVAVDRL